MKDKRKKNNINIIKVLMLLIILLSSILIWKIIQGNKSKKATLEENKTFETSVNITDNNETELSNMITNEAKENNAVSNEISNSIKASNLNEIDNVATSSKPVTSGEKLGKEGLPVLMYHFFYDASKGETARDGNWLEIKNFENHLKYLTENNFYFPSWEEVIEYIDGKIELPKKSIVLTVDDGEETFFSIALPVIKKYDVKMTEFLVTSWNGWFKHDYPARQVSYQSHSDSMHKGGDNGKGVMTSWNYNNILTDCINSRKALDNEAIVFCYPFGQYTNEAKRAVKEAGFKLAFTTQSGRVKVGSDKLELPRIRTSTNTTVEVLKKLVE